MHESSDIAEVDNQSEKYSSAELNTLITANSNFNLESMMALSDVEKFNDALFEITDRASYYSELAAKSEKHLELFDELDAVKGGRLFIENLACDKSFCMASLQLTEGYKWDDSVLDKLDNGATNTYSAPLKGKSFNRQILFARRMTIFEVLKIVTRFLLKRKQ